MKLNIEPLIARARKVTTIAVSSTMEIIVIDDVVDARTGVPTMVSADRLRGRSVWEAALFLHANYAGDTAFVIRTPTTFALVRAPFSELPIYYWQRGETLEVWSGLEAPAILVEQRPEFDRAYLAGRLLNWSWMTPATGLCGVSELLSGAVVMFDGQRLRQQDLLADTVKRLEADTKSPYEKQVAVFRQLISNSVQHKAGPSLGQVSILCSGGVDSSVVAVAAAALYPDRRLPLIHCYSEEHANGDERFYFDTVAEKVGASNHRVDMYAGASKTSLSPELLSASTRPSKSAAALPQIAGMYEVARANGSKVVLSGDGGDQLFLLNNPSLYSREIASEAASPLAALRALTGLAIQERCTFWGIADEVLRARQASRLRQHLFGDKRFKGNPIAKMAIPNATQVVPNGDALATLGVSRAFQFFGMRNAELNRVQLADYRIDELKVFVFWPLIRAALCAQRGHHLQGGRDRALERDSFKAELPQAIYHRVGKGTGRDFMERYDFESLAAGLLTSPIVRYGLVDREHIRNISSKNIDHETAFALVTARGISDWMGFYE